LAESDAQYRKRREREDAQAVALGRKMAAFDEAQALSGGFGSMKNIRMQPMSNNIELVPLGKGIPSGVLNQERTGKQIDRLIHGARMMGDPEYAKQFMPGPMPELKRAGMDKFMPEAVDVPTGDMFSSDDMQRYTGMMNTLSKTDFYQAQPLQDRPNFTSKKRQSALDALKEGMMKAKMQQKMDIPMEIRRAEDSPLPGDVVDAKLEPGEYVLNRNAVKAIGKKQLDKINNKIKPRFSDKIRKKARDLPRSISLGARREDWQKYMQTGGPIEEIDLTGMEDQMGFGENRYADAEELGEQTIQKGVEFGKKLYGGAKDLLGKAYNRFGGDAIKASKAMDLQADLNSEWAGGVDGEAFEGQKEFEDSNLEMAKMMRDEMGLGKADYGMAAGQFGQQVVDDLQAGLGAGVAGAGAIANKAQELYGKASDKYQEFKPKAKEYLESEKFQKHASKGLGMAGEFFKEMAAMRGFGEGGDFDQFKPKALKKVGEEETKEIPDTIKRPNYSTDPEDVAKEQKEQEAVEELRVTNPYIARPESMEPETLEDITNPLGGITGMGGQEGGYVTMQGFIKQSLENMYGRN
tara:strand:- start:2235 stop:3968 length:1734 start_codon:yes stop_codon:yes gene_type:complete